MTMKVLIMWSKPRSSRVATELYRFLGAVIQRPQYFVSTEDVPSGSVWNNVLAGELETTHFGIACLCRDNLESAWMHFEAGAISKASGRAVVVPYLIGIEPSEVVGPLTKFQAATADRKGTLALVQSINDAQTELDRTTPTALETVFSALWGGLEKTIREASALPDGAVKTQPRSQADMLREILDRLRDQERRTAATSLRAESDAVLGPSRGLGLDAIAPAVGLWCGKAPEDAGAELLMRHKLSAFHVATTEEAEAFVRKMPMECSFIVIRTNSQREAAEWLDFLRQSPPDVKTLPCAVITTNERVSDNIIHGTTPVHMIVSSLDGLGGFLADISLWARRR